MPVDAALLEKLRDGLRSPEPSIRIHSAERLRNLGDPAVALMLVPSLEDSEFEVSETAAQCLRDLVKLKPKDRKLNAALVNALNSRHWSARQGAVELLGEMRRPDSVEHIGSLIRDEPYEVIVASALDSLAKFGGRRESVPHAFTALKRFPTDASIRLAAAKVLAQAEKAVARPKTLEERAVRLALVYAQRANVRANAEVFLAALKKLKSEEELGLKGSEERALAYSKANPPSQALF
jgi:HEAT repeat protein